MSKFLAVFLYKNTRDAEGRRCRSLFHTKVFADTDYWKVLDYAERANWFYELEWKIVDTSGQVIAASFEVKNEKSA